MEPFTIEVWHPSGFGTITKQGPFDLTDPVLSRQYRPGGSAWWGGKIIEGRYMSRPDRRVKYPLRELSVGDKFFVEGYEKNVIRMRQIVCQYARRNGGKFSVKKDKKKDGLWVWRVK